MVFGVAHRVSSFTSTCPRPVPNGYDLNVEACDAVMRKLGYEFGGTFIDSGHGNINFGLHSLIAGVSGL